jgi:hypothetical protein
MLYLSPFSEILYLAIFIGLQLKLIQKQVNNPEKDIVPLSPERPNSVT